MHADIKCSFQMFLPGQRNSMTIEFYNKVFANTFSKLSLKHNSFMMFVESISVLGTSLKILLVTVGVEPMTFGMLAD